MNQKNKSRQILLAAVIVLSVVLILLLAVLFGMDHKEPDHNSGTETKQTTPQPEESTQPTQPSAETTQPSQKPTSTQPPSKVPEETKPVCEDVQVQTAYCDLFYSRQWADSIRTERTTKDFAETILFYGTAEGKETALFAVYFADASDNSFPVGAYSTAAGLTVDISVELFELERDGWTDAGFDQLCAMQEQVNYVIAMLAQTAGFIPA